MRRVVIASVATAACFGVAVPSSSADPEPNAHNCNGVFFSSRAPEEQRNGQQGDRARTQALAGTRGEILRANTEFRANCGQNPD